MQIWDADNGYKPMCKIEQLSPGAGAGIKVFEFSPKSSFVATYEQYQKELNKENVRVFVCVAPLPWPYGLLLYLLPCPVRVGTFYDFFFSTCLPLRSELSGFPKSTAECLAVLGVLCIVCVVVAAGPCTALNKVMIV